MKISLRSRPTETGKQSLYLDFYQNGKRWYESINLYLIGDRDQDKQTKRLAETILSQRRLDAAATENVLPAPSRMKADFIEYCRKLGESKPSENTRLVWKNTIAHLEAFAGKEGITFGSVNEGFLEDFRDYLLSRVSPNTAGVYLARIKTACRKAASQQILPRYNGSNVTIKKQKTHREYLTLEELRKLAESPPENQAVRDSFLFACFAGLRFSDVKALTWDKVRTEGNQTLLWFSQEKTKDAEALPLSPQAVEILEAQRTATASPKLMHAIDKDKLFKLPAQQTVDKAIKRWARRAGITKKVSFHVGRHTFATLGLAHGIDLYVMSKLLGHRRVETTEIYAKVIDKSKRDAVNMLPRLHHNR
jgi:site-specific recombinase XerD